MMLPSFFSKNNPYLNIVLDFCKTNQIFLFIKMGIFQ
jgi:hypothetical protein